MVTRIAIAVWLGLTGVPAIGQIGAAEGDALAPFGWLRELAGACWRGQQSDGKPTDTQCYETQYGHFLRGTISMSGAVPDKPAAELRGDSVWAWDAARKRVTVTTWASNGTITSGEAWYEGEAVVFPVPRRDGGEATARTRWQRIDADSFNVTRQRREGNDWLDGLTVTYRRVR
jgi:hypothetical protein